MLGTAAKSSMTLDRGFLTDQGAISAKKIAIPILSGTPTATAIADVTSVPNTKGRAL